MRALVTGAAGFVGRHLFPKLEAAGYEVMGIDPAGAQPSLELIAKLRYLQHHGAFPEEQKRAQLAAELELSALSDAERWRTSSCREIESFPFSEFDLVVHLAANIVNVDARMKGGMSMFDDIELDLAMCRWLEKNPPKQCAVLMSSCAVDFPEDPYCIVKRNLESFAQTLHKKGVPVIVLRPFSGYGEDQSEEYPFRAILERALRKEDPLTVWGGSQVRDWIHIDDLTDAILFAIKELPRDSAPVEVGTQIGTSLHQLAEMMAYAIPYSPTVKHDPTKTRSSARRVSGENIGVRFLQAWGWKPKIGLPFGIRRARRALAAQLAHSRLVNL